MGHANEFTTDSQARVVAEELERRCLFAVGLVSDIYQTDGGGSSPSDLVSVNGLLFFSANDGHHGRELWRSDGTAAGTTMVRDIIPGKAGSNPTALANINGTLYFSVDDPTAGVEVWKSDGTSDGTVMVDNVTPLHGSVDQFTMIGKTLYFQGTGQATRDIDLYASNGKPNGTTILKVASDNDVSNGEQFDRLTSFAGELFFFDDDQPNVGVGASTLYKTDGTIAGTESLAGFDETFDAIVYKDNLYFQGNTGMANGNGLWRSDGSSAGTKLFSSLDNPQSFDVLNDELIFSASDPVNGTEERKTDGTVNGTGLIKDIAEGSPDSSFGNGVISNGRFYFSSGDNIHGSEPWVSDGSEAGTQLLKDINTRAADPNSFPDQFTAAGDKFYFVADDYSHGRELWVSDGTAAGTSRISDVNPGRASSDIANLTSVGGTLFFTVDDGVHGEELWSVPGPFASIDGRTLRVNGTDAADTLGLRVRGTNLQVRLNGALLSFSKADIDRIEINSGPGNDVVDWSGIDTPTYINAGAGNDSVTAGSGNDTLTGACGKRYIVWRTRRRSPCRQQQHRPPFRRVGQRHNLRQRGQRPTRWRRGHRSSLRRR